MVSETSEDKVSGNGEPEKKGQIIANFYQNSLCNVSGNGEPEKKGQIIANFYQNSLCNENILYRKW